jgi:hypothetical protein
MSNTLLVAFPCHTTDRKKRKNYTAHYTLHTPHYTGGSVFGVAGVAHQGPFASDLGLTTRAHTHTHTQTHTHTHTHTYTHTHTH